MIKRVYSFNKLLELTGDQRTTLVVLDIDNTIMASGNYYGSISWLKEQHGKLSQLYPNKTTKQIQDLFYPDWIRSQEECQMLLCNSGLPKIINLIRFNIDVIGLTSRSPYQNFMDITDRQLTNLGVHLDLVRFVGEGNNKGEALERRIIEKGYKSIVVYDDYIVNLLNIEATCKKLGVHCDLYLFQFPKWLKKLQLHQKKILEALTDETQFNRKHRGGRK